MKLLKQLSLFYWRYLKSSESYARHLGVKIGHNCLIATHNWPSEPYLITIGNYVQLANGVSIHTHGGGHSVRCEHPNFDIFGKVLIKDWAYVGAFSQIMPGVTIGEGAIVAAGSVVTKSVAPHSVVAGNPAKFVCSMEVFYEKNKAFNVGTFGCQPSEKKRLLLSLPDDKFLIK